MGLALLYALSSLIVGIIVLALGFYFTSLVLAQS
jgi:CrcB protein